MSEGGVEPLTAPTQPSEATTATVSQELEAFEADDFWASGETQQFVGTGGSSTPVGASVNDDVDDRLAPAQPAFEAPGYGGDASALGWRQLRVPVPTTWIAAGLVIAALVATGVLIVSLTGGTSYKVARQSSQSLATAVKPAKPWVAISATPHPVRRHVARPHGTKPATSGPSTSAGSTSGSSQPPTSAPVSAQPVYQPSPAASAASDSGTSSGGGGGGGSSSSSQRAGPTSVIGLGTSPSG